MKSTAVYKALEKDFITPKLSDEWAVHMDSLGDLMSANFKKRSMGLVCDFTKEINHVYTAVFPSNPVLQRILEEEAEDAMLFVHHPATWDIRQAPKVFQQMDRELLERLRERRISIYNLHVPLDDYGPYSTSVTLAKALGIQPEKPFAHYFGSLSGVLGKTKASTVQELKKVFEKSMGHKVSLYPYGNKKIKNNMVAIIAGGGNEVGMLAEIAQAGVNTFVTGITAKNDHSRKAHEFAEANRINILGGTHYSTETFACIAMCDYFKKMGLPAKFTPDKPVMEDL